MSKTIKELFYGNLAPGERLPQSKEQRRKNAVLSKAMDDLEEKLSKSLQDELEDVLDKQAEVFELEAAEAFAEGFRLGTRLSVEVFGKNAGVD